MWYADGEVARAHGDTRPWIAAQVIRETDTGDALLGRVDAHLYGLQFGVKHHSIEATLNYAYLPKRSDAFNNGGLVTPYSSAESSGPIFAQPLITTFQDLGAGNAFSATLKGSPIDNTTVGGQYSYMELQPDASEPSLDQSEYLVFGAYHFQGIFKGLSLRNTFAYYSRRHAWFKQTNHKPNYWENRLGLSYDF